MNVGCIRRRVHLEVMIEKIGLENSAGVEQSLFFCCPRTGRFSRASIRSCRLDRCRFTPFAPCHNTLAHTIHLPTPKKKIFQTLQKSNKST